MAIKDNDYLETGVSFRTQFGGNGDYYFEIWGKDKKGLNNVKHIRFAMSGGPLGKHVDVKIAIANLYREMEKAGLNAHPYDDELNNNIKNK